ncbi:MAG: hypothetical protein J6N18_08300 [Kiritimatiellae bacterium]|nr:hypothetical protein [Kiritimatiellia bacterium]
MCLGNPIASPLAWPSWEYGPSGSPEALRRRSDTVVRNVRAAARLYTGCNEIFMQNQTPLYSLCR